MYNLDEMGGEKDFKWKYVKIFYLNMQNSS